jgi:hypothetical protein
MLCVFLFYDRDIGYYTRGAALPIIFNVLLVLAVVLIGVGAFVFTKDKQIRGERNPRYVRMAAVVPFMTFLVFLANAVNKMSAFSLHGVKLDITFYISVICAVCGAVYFVLIALGKGENALGLALGFFTIVWFILALASSYFDAYVPMNSPDKFIFHLACLSAMLFILGELRYYFAAPRKALYLFSVSIAIVLLFATSVPSILVTVFASGGLYNYVLLAEDTVCLGLAVFSSVKLLSFVLDKENSEADEGEEKITNEESEESVCDDVAGTADNVEASEMSDSGEVTEDTEDENSEVSDECQ